VTILGRLDQLLAFDLGQIFRMSALAGRIRTFRFS
jgi:hypothetical protein